jgi:Protein of unknown function (DUF2591)
MKVKTASLIGRSLNWAVAGAEGNYSIYCDCGYGEVWEPESNWAQGGPIIERENITLRLWDNGYEPTAYMPLGSKEHSLWYQGPTPLIAAMRCYVASKLGDEIEIPEELT